MRLNYSEKLTELTPNTYFLFREGMSLRKYQIIQLFSDPAILDDHPDLIFEDKDYMIRGTGHLRDLVERPIPYDFDSFKLLCKDIYRMYKDGEKLTTTRLNALPEAMGVSPQTKIGLMTGVLKHDARGYYIDPKAIEGLK